MNVMSEADIEKALLAIRAEDYQQGAAWEAAHELAQVHEGDPAFDRLHAFLHRIEQDASNAAYWYRRAGEPIHQGDLASECAVLIERSRG